MIRNNVAVVGIGLGGTKVAYEFQKRNYSTYLINGSKQDNRCISGAKNILILEKYDGLAGERSLAYDALKDNTAILKKISEIPEKVILLVATGGGTTGSGTIPYIADMCCNIPDKIVCAALMMPRQDEPIQKRLNAYNAAKELMEIEELGAAIFINNESENNLDRINFNFVNMMDAFFKDDSASSTSNFDDAEKYKMLSDHGAFVTSMRCSKSDAAVTTQDMIDSLTAKNIFLPINNDGIVSHIGIINQKGVQVDEHEIIKAIGNPENIFIGNNGGASIVCASGLGFPVEYISGLGKKALEEQKERVQKKKAFSILDELEEIAEEKPAAMSKPKSKRRTISLDLLNSL